MEISTRSHPQNKQGKSVSLIFSACSVSEIWWQFPLEIILLPHSGGGSFQLLLSRTDIFEQKGISKFRKSWNIHHLHYKLVKVAFILRNKHTYPGKPIYIWSNYDLGPTDDHGEYHWSRCHTPMGTFCRFLGRRSFIIGGFKWENCNMF